MGSETRKIYRYFFYFVSKQPSLPKVKEKTLLVLGENTFRFVMTEKRA